MAIFRITVGRLLCSKVRDYLESLKFLGYNLDYLESSGLIEREFVVKGDMEAINKASDALIRWSKRINETP